MSFPCLPSTQAPDDGDNLVHLVDRWTCDTYHITCAVTRAYAYTATVIRRCVALLVGLATLFPNVALPQSPDDATNPVRIGDYWTYETKDEITGRATRAYTGTVSEITPAEIVTHLTFRGNNGTGLVAFDHQWNRTANGELRYKPNDAHGVQFPLSIGKEWLAEYISSNVRTGVNFKGSSLSKVTAREMVTSPAGTFDTFKVERQVKEYNAADPSRSTEAQFILWYAPQINHWARRTIVTKIDKRTLSNQTDELIEYGRKQ
jgi:hypothetical protein